jgi:hypothetical protein
MGLTNSQLQLRVLRFGLCQDGDVPVGVFPVSEEIFVGGADASGVGIRAVCTFACKAFARAAPRCANAPVQQFQMPTGGAAVSLTSLAPPDTINRAT